MASETAPAPGEVDAVERAQVELSLACHERGESTPGSVTVGGNSKAEIFRNAMIAVASADAAERDRVA